jgi:hypothetical protein
MRSWDIVNLTMPRSPHLLQELHQDALRIGSGATIQLTVPCVVEERWIGGWRRELRQGASQAWGRSAMDEQSE